MNFLRHRLLALTLLVGPALAAENAPGAKLYAACAVCHAPDSPTRTGPDLRGVVGRVAGSVPGFRYSRALKAAKRVWDESALDAFLTDPQAAVPGTTMPFPGLPDAKARRDLIAFLRTLK